jgi:CPA2 family monovalent cation:H+ antiporter-2
MHEDFIKDLAVVTLVAALVTVLFHVLKQPVVLGYIIAGVIVGPHTPGLGIDDEHTINIMAELGVILLMFGLGLHFSLRRLASVGGTALLAASLEIVVMVVVGYVIGRAFGWSPMDSLFLGAILSISSTTIIVKALADLGMSKKPFAELIFGILIFEDILAIAMIALLSGIAREKALVLSEVGLTLGKLGIFLAAVLVGGLLTVPWLLRQVNKLKSNETMLITALGLCFGVSLLAAAMHFSVALGAFLIGAIIAEARERGKVETLVEPVRDLFSAIFFVTIGMLIKPSTLIDYAWPIVVVTIAVVVGKVISCSIGTFLAGHGARTSVRVGMGLAQIGEFSFIIATLGQTTKVTSDFLYPLAVTVSAITTLLTPYLIRSSDPVVNLLARKAPVGLVDSARLFSRWMRDRRAGSGDNTLRKLLRKWMLQIGLNLVLISAVFIAAVALAPRAQRFLPWLPGWTGQSKAALWLVAVLLCLPMLVATLRKLRAVALVLAEVSVKTSTAPQQLAAVRAAVANSVFFAGCVVIGLLLLLLGSTILPPWPVLIVMLFIVAVVTVLTWRSLIKVYAKAQISLHETLTQEIAHEREPELPSVLRSAELETIQIAPDSPAAGKLIRELELRTRSGASAVAIERDGADVINPGPDEEIQSGDKVLLLGSRAQLDAARTFLLLGKQSR